MPLISLIEVPTALGLSPSPGPSGRPRGTWRAPGALRAAGLATRLGALAGGAIPIDDYDAGREPGTGARNTQAVAAQTMALADHVDRALQEGHRPLVVGGDCSVLLGPASALRRRGRYGLIFIDGHLDYRHPGNSGRLSAVAGEDLAIVTGRGLAELTDIAGGRPYFADSDVIAIGEREHDPATADVHATETVVIPLAELRRAGIPEVAVESVARLTESSVDGFWVHLDVDVLDSELMPAVDSPQPGGLTASELTRLLRVVMGHPLAVGLDVTVYDPELDPTDRCATVIRDVLIASLGITSP